MSLATARPDYYRGVREVPAFTVQVLQECTVAAQRPHEEIRECRPAGPTWLRILYQSRRIPVKLAHGNKFAIVWQKTSDELEVERLLPIFYDGLTETTYPYNFLARQGITALLDIARQRVVCVIHSLVAPIRKALNTRMPEVLGATLIAVQQLACSDPLAGQMLVQYYQNILPMLRMFYYWTVEVETQIGVAPVKMKRINDMILETLHVLEKTGGPHAFHFIKLSIPVYTSWMAVD